MEKKNQLFFYALPGLANIKDAKKNLNQFSRFIFNNNKPGFNFQFGSGIKWVIKNHSFFFSGGYSITNYSIIANEYPIIINPYNPTVEETILHKYKLKYSKIHLRLGFQL